MAKKAAKKAARPSSKPKPAKPSPVRPSRRSVKDPGIATLISVVGMILFAAPALGYFFINETRKGLIYLLAGWALLAAVVVAYVLGALTYVGAFCCLPLLLVPLLFNLAVIWDVYLLASHQEPRLPSFD